LQRYDIELTPTLYSVEAGHRLQVVLSTQPPPDKCASLLSALTIPLPCLPSAPKQKALAGGNYEVEWSRSVRFRVPIPMIDNGAPLAATSAPTPTSNGRAEPLVWDSPPPS
jgi:predicted acyl esterase